MESGEVSRSPDERWSLQVVSSSNGDNKTQSRTSLARLKQKKVEFFWGNLHFSPLEKFQNPKKNNLSKIFNKLGLSCAMLSKAYATY